MVKVFVALHYYPEEYGVVVSVYGGSGDLLWEKRMRAKQVVLEAPLRVRVSRQIGPNPIVLILDAEEPPVVEEKEGVVVIRSGGGRGEG